MIKGLWITNVHKSEFERADKFGWHWYKELLSKLLVGDPKPTKKKTKEQLLSEGYVGLYSSENLSMSELNLLGVNFGVSRKKRKKKENLIEIDDYDFDIAFEEEFQRSDFYGEEFVIEPSSEMSDY